MSSSKIILEVKTKGITAFSFKIPILDQSGEVFEDEQLTTSHFIIGKFA